MEVQGAGQMLKPWIGHCYCSCRYGRIDEFRAKVPHVYSGTPNKHTKAFEGS
jgi:hypothetical protein